jgi:hypothetical protein
MKQSSVSGLEWFYHPVEVEDNGYFDTYVHDGYSNGQSDTTLKCGGIAADPNLKWGLFARFCTSSSDYGPNQGSRLMKLPNS